MGKGALRPFFKGHSLKKKKSMKKRKWTKCFRILSHSRFRPARWIGPAGHWICLKGKAPAG